MPAVHLVALDPDLLALPLFSRGEAVSRALACLDGDPKGRNPVLLGGPGQGKSLLLHRICAEIQRDPARGARWQPVLLPEDLPQLAWLSDLWVEALRGLAAALSLRGAREGAEAIQRALAALPLDEEPLRARIALDLLRGWARLEGRALLLAVDELDAVAASLGEGWHGLMEALAAEPWLRLLGASRRAVAPTYSFDRSWIERFFAIQIPPLSAAEGADLVVDRGRRAGLGAVAARLEAQRAALESLGPLIGGAPQGWVYLAAGQALRSDAPLEAALDASLDLATPLHRGRLLALAPQARLIVDLLGAVWGPIGAAELAARSRLDVNAVSSQLSRLVKQRVVERVALPEGSRAAFQLADRSFNLWLLVRGGGEGAARLRAFVRFLGATAGLERQPPALPASLRDALPEGPPPPPEALPVWTPGDRTAELVGDGGEQALQAALARDEADLAAWNALGVALLAGPRGVGEAESAWRQGLERCPQADPALRARVIANLGARAQERGEGGEAEALLREAVAVDPAFTEGLRVLAQILLAGGRAGEAEAALRRLTALAPGEPEGWLLRSAAARLAGDGAAAERAAREGLALQEDAEACFTLGEALAAQGRARDAEQAWRAGLRLDPGHGPSQRALGEALARDPARAAEAEEWLRRAAEQSGRAQSALAWLRFARGGDRAEAEALARRAALRGQAAGADALLAALKIAEGRREEALERLAGVLDSALAARDPAWLCTAIRLSCAAARAGWAAELLELIRDGEASLAWEPLIAALRASLGEDPELRALPAELRGTASWLRAWMGVSEGAPEVEEPRDGRRRGRRPRPSW